MSQPDPFRLPSLHAAQTEIVEQWGARSIMRCGRRFGKTTLVETKAAQWAYHGRKVGVFAPSYKLVLPTYKRILKHLMPWVTNKSKVDMLIETKSTKGSGLVEFWTLTDEDAGRSRSYDWVIIDEASLVSGLQDIWERSIAPTLLDRRGKAVMAGTPKGIDDTNYFYNSCTNKDLGWKEFHAPTSRNPMLDPVGVANLVNEYPPLVYQQEFLAEFVSWAGAAFFSEVSMLNDGAPVDYPRKCDFVFAVMDTATKEGAEHDGTAVMYCARNVYTGVPLTILDWDVVQISGDLLPAYLPTVHARAVQLAAQCGARQGHRGIWVEDKSSGMVINQQAARSGALVFPIDTKMTALGKEERALNASPAVYQGKVKFSDHAYNKKSNFKGQNRNHMLAQVCGFRMGQKRAHDDLLDAFTYSVAISLGDSQGW